MALRQGVANPGVGFGTSTASTLRTSFLELDTHRYQSDIRSSWNYNSLVRNTQLVLPLIFLPKQTSKTVPDITLPSLGNPRCPPAPSKSAEGREQFPWMVKSSWSDSQCLMENKSHLDNWKIKSPSPLFQDMIKRRNPLSTQLLEQPLWTYCTHWWPGVLPAPRCCK